MGKEMDAQTLQTMQQCTLASFSGEMNFPQIVSKLMERGVESYHVDIHRLEKTYYMPDGSNHVESMPMPAYPISQKFSLEGVKEAIKNVQQAKIDYLSFMHAIMDAGVVNYVVYLQGKCVSYIGRGGEAHIEYFPGTR